jgi:spore coat protein H
MQQSLATRLRVVWWTSTLLVVGACESASTTGEPNAAIDAAVDSGGYTNAPVRPTHELGLPVLYLDVDEGINDADYTPATLSYDGHEYFGAQAKHRGATSHSYPKRSFTLKLDKEDRFTDEAHGFHSVRRLVLTSTFDDSSQIRQRLAFELWNRLDPEHIAIHHFNAVVYLNGTYHGIYVATDHVNDDFLEQRGLPAKVNMYKARLKEANFRLTDRNGEPKQQLRAGYTKEEGSPAAGEPEAFADLDALLSWIATADDADFRENFSARLTPDFLHWFIFVTLSQAVDTTTKNYFLVHDARPQTPDARWRFIPWDFNASFGQGSITQRRAPDYWTIARFGRANRLFERMLNEPTLRARLMQRFRETVQGVWTEEEIALTLERFAGDVAPAAERDELLWGEARRATFSDRRDWTSPAEELAYLRAWVPARWRQIIDELDE